MQLQTISALFLLLAICYIATVASEVFIDDFVKTQSMFNALLIGTLITCAAALVINIKIP